MAGFDEREIFVAGPVVVFRWLNEAGWPVEYASPNAAGVFGYSAAEFTGGEVSYAALIAPEDGPRVAREVAAASESDVASFVHEPYRIRHRAGGIRWLYDFTNVVRDEAGRATHFLGYVIDITAHMQAEAEKRELERRFLQAQKLESLGLLAGGVAHDFNNLLAGILGHASLARRALAQGSAEVGAAVDQIETLAIRAGELTRQLLAYSGRGRLSVHPIDLGELVRDTARMLEVVVSNQATLRLEVASELPAVEVDPTQIRQIVMNLITNASDALGHREGTISIRVTPRELDRQRLAHEFGATERAAGRYVSLEVTDTGCGMDDSVIAKLFDPFFTTKASGRGLGMSAVLGTVRGHEGAIRVRSKPGEGSSFEIVLPASDKPVPRAEAREARTP